MLFFGQSRSGCLHDRLRLTHLSSTSVYLKHSKPVSRANDERFRSNNQAAVIGIPSVDPSKRTTQITMCKRNMMKSRNIFPQAGRIRNETRITRPPGPHYSPRLRWAASHRINPAPVLEACAEPTPCLGARLTLDNQRRRLESE